MPDHPIFVGPWTDEEVATIRSTLVQCHLPLANYTFTCHRLPRKEKLFIVNQHSFSWKLFSTRSFADLLAHLKAGDRASARQT